MFKIRSPQFDDLKKIKEIICNNPHVIIHELPLYKFAYFIQNLIPYNLRFFPSIHIAVEEKNILGFVILESLSKSNNCWQIDEVFVLDESRNKGIGEELLRYVLSVYGSHGVEHFLAEVDSQNFPALSLFHQCGFRRYAKVGFYKKNVEALNATSLLDKDFTLRPQTNNDLAEIEKLELASIPPDLRPALGRAKEYFKQKKNTTVLIDKSRNLIIGWGQIELSGESNCIEILLSPGWTHLYEEFLNTIISEYTIKANNCNVIVKAFDYLTDLTEVLTKSGFLQVEVKELLVRTIWQRVKERKAKKAKLGAPSIAPT
ncbi:MAG: GNAT family N-acetyltransferase [Candidatus Melainabacteria bacterium]|nr:GNAT family N-acetyltransferase [Candidatus Melainabacteria bacterium]